jgi:hypothetical protein
MTDFPPLPLWHAVEAVRPALVPRSRIEAPATTATTTTTATATATTFSAANVLHRHVVIKIVPVA